MWIWEKKITQNDESQWAEKLSGVVGVVFTTLPDSEKSLVQCYCEEAASAAALLTAFGGKMSKLEDRDWVAATAPENSPSPYPQPFGDRVFSFSSKTDAATLPQTASPLFSGGKSLRHRQPRYHSYLSAHAL